MEKNQIKYNHNTMEKESQNIRIPKPIYHPSLIRRLQAPVIMKMLDPKKNNIILDAGCGNGFFSYKLAENCRCVGIDLKISENFSYSKRGSSNITYIKSDVRYMPFNAESFDKILLSSVLQMVKNDERLLRECYRILTKDGVLVLSIPLEYVYVKKLNKLKGELIKIFESKGKGFYGFEEIIRLLEEAGFEIIETEYAPKKLGSFLYEVKLYLCYLTGLSFYHPLIDDIIYPLAYCEKFSINKIGNELIVKVRKN